MDQRKMDEIKHNPIIATIDIETGSLANRAVIFSIGVVLGNVMTGEVLDKFYVRCTQSSQDDRVIDEDTMKHFWSDLSKVTERARREIYDPKLPRVSLADGLSKLNNFFREAQHTRKIDLIQLFGNGSDFDNAIVLEAMRYYGIPPAWKFYCNQSLRTLVWLGRLLVQTDPKNEMEFEGTVHHALDDALHEFKYACAIVKAIKGKLVIDPPY